MGDFSKKATVYGIVTDQFVKLLQAGQIPWTNRFKINGCPHMNLTTKTPYNGVNRLIAASRGFNSPFWISRKQSFQMGMDISPDQDYTTIIYYNFFDDESDPEKKRKIPFVRYSQCFNIEQMSHIPAGLVPTLPEVRVPILEAEVLLDKIKPFLPPIQIGAVSTYSRDKDIILMMNQDQYVDKAEFYTDLFKQCILSTLHDSRLKLNKVAPIEMELMAEIGSAFLCQECNVKFNINDSAKYIAHWVGRLTNDAKLIIMASKKAYAAAEFLLKRHNEEAEHDYKKMFIENTLRKI